MATWLSQCIEIGGMGLFYNGKSYRNFLINSASALAVSKAIISASMVDHEIIDYLADFHDTAPPSKVKT